MHINYRAVQLPVSQLLFNGTRNTGLCIPLCVRGVGPKGAPAGVSRGQIRGQEESVLCVPQLTPYWGEWAVYTDHSYCHFRYSLDEGKHHHFMFKELGNYWRFFDCRTMSIAKRKGAGGKIMSLQ